MSHDLAQTNDGEYRMSTERFEHDSRLHAISSDVLAVTLVSLAVVGAAVGAIVVLVMEGLR